MTILTLQKRPSLHGLFLAAWVVLPVLLSGCRPGGSLDAKADLLPPGTPFANPAHLEHLYEERVIDGDTLGCIWIYCEAPDYRLVGDSDEGFTCVDDVARSLVFYSRKAMADPSPANLLKIRRLTRFLLHMRADNGYFYNFLLPDGTRNTTHENSRAIPGWWTWRAFWALSEMRLVGDSSLSNLRAEVTPILDSLVTRMDSLCLDPAMPVMFDGITLPACLASLGADQLSVVLTGLVRYEQVARSDKGRALILHFGNLLFRDRIGGATNPHEYAFFSWQNQWHAWGNGQAYALLMAGQLLGHPPFIDAAINEVRNFYPYLLDQGYISAFRLDCEQGCQVRDEKQFPQIAYGLRPMITAALEAYRVTADTTYARTAALLGAWYFGRNASGRPMYDPATGRTYDGLNSARDINNNAGAESTIEGLLSLQAINAFQPAKARLDHYLETSKD